MIKLPLKVKRGDSITADDFNALIDAVAQIPVIRSGPGIEVVNSSAGVLIALAALTNGEAVAARITQVYGSDGDRIENVFYDALPLGADPAQSTLVHATPKYGRIFASGPAVQTARVGDLCAIIRVPKDEGGTTGDLCILTEQILSRQCGGAPAPLSGTASALKKRPDKLPLENRPPDAFINIGLGKGSGGGSFRSVIPPGTGFESLG